MGPIGPESTRPNRVESRRPHRRCCHRRLRQSLTESWRLAIPIIKISIILAAAFSPRWERACFAGSSGVFFLGAFTCVCVCRLSPSFVPEFLSCASAIYARRRSRPGTQLKRNCRKEGSDYGRTMK